MKSNEYISAAACTQCINESYSTTRMVTRKKPHIRNTSEDQFETIFFFPAKSKDRKDGGLRTKGYFKQSFPEKPLISIITVVFNGEKHLEETIRSVLNQTFDNVEYIIIDGGSTDGTLDIIRQYDGQIDYWISESDDGIYDAMNKGIQLSTGNIIGIVNADDCIYKDTLEHVSCAFVENPDIWYTCGTVDFVDEKGMIFCKARSLKEEELAGRKFKQMPYPHQTMYVSKRAYKEIGLFDLSYQLRADYDFLLKLLDSGKKSYELSGSVGFFRSGGRSGGIKTYIEMRRLLKQHGVNRIVIEWNFGLWMVKLFLVTVCPFGLIKFLNRWRKKTTFQYL